MAAHNERAYYEKWLAQLDEETDSYRLARNGGALAENFAQIFCAGYQAALRCLFADLNLRGWSALAVSEDRSQSDPLPGVSLIESSGYPRLHGYKTWVAACDCISSLIVSVDADGQTRLAWVPVPSEGLGIEAYPAPKMLPGMSQGRAHFQAVAVAPSDGLDPSALRYFSRLESTCVYVAFAAALEKIPGMAYTAATLLQSAEQLLCSAPVLDKSQALSFNRAVNQAAALLRKSEHMSQAAWLAEPSLIQMYAR